MNKWRFLIIGLKNQYDRFQLIEPFERGEIFSEIYEKLETLVKKKDVKKNQIVEHDNYVKELLRYIITDLKRFRQIQGDNTLGGMIICETSEQARKLFAYFDEIQNELNKTASLL